MSTAANLETLDKDLDFVQRVKGTTNQECPEFYTALNNVLAYAEGKWIDELAHADEDDEYWITY